MIRVRDHFRKNKMMKMLLKNILFKNITNQIKNLQNTKDRYPLEFWKKLIY